MPKMLNAGAPETISFTVISADGMRLVCCTSCEYAHEFAWGMNIVSNDSDGYTVRFDVADGCYLLTFAVPEAVELMLDLFGAYWGRAAIAREYRAEWVRMDGSEVSLHV